MRRIQFIELHEQAWFPSSLRADVTDALQFGFNLLHAYAPIVPLLQNVIDSTGNGTNARQSSTTESIVDMCSGGGGPWLDLARQLRCRDAGESSAGLQIWLTDKYPNLEAFQSVSASSDHHITFYPEPVDAMKVPGALKGLRTMFTSFHHFSPEDARAILQNAIDAGESIGIFEATKRAPSTIGLIFAGILLLFDGVVSCLRTYRPQELREMVEKLTSCQYQWEIGELATGKMPVTYLIGYPKSRPMHLIRP